MAKHTVQSGKRPANPKPAPIGHQDATTSAALETPNHESGNTENMNMMIEIEVPTTSYEASIGARLPMFPAGISDGMRALVEKWRTQRGVINATEGDKETDAAVEVGCSIQAEIEDYPARSMGDVAAKLAIAAFVINGAETNIQSGITDDDHLMIFEEPDHHNAETIYVAAAEDAARLAEEQAHPAFAPNEDFWRALAAFETAHANCNAAVTDDETDRLGDIETEAVEALLEIPSPDFRAATEKLRAFLAAYATSHDDILELILEDMDRLSVAESPALVDAFESFRAAFGLLKAADVNADTDPFYKIMDPADGIMADTPATTPAGVAMKLKRAFVALVGADWSDYAVFTDRPAAFTEGVKLSDIYHRMFWSAIEDLDRMPTMVDAGPIPTTAASMQDVHIGAEQVDPHRAWLDERDAALAAAINAREPSDEEMAQLAGAYSDIEDRIWETPATSPEGAMVKLLTLLQQPPMGNYIDPDIARPIVEEAARLIGSRTLGSMKEA